MRILVTGATGFVGSALVRQLAQCSPAHQVVALVRSGRTAGLPPAGVQMVTGELGTGGGDWRDALAGVSVVVHCAARAHVMSETAADPVVEFRRVNVEGTLELARHAAACGVRRFVFVSSIGVNGAATLRTPFAMGDTAAPHSPYAVSKHEAETALRELASHTGMEVVIVRPPLVYGPAAPGNFGLLMRCVRRGLPLPLGSVTQNRRSLVGIDNLVDLLTVCLEHPAAANQTFLVSDGEDMSTADLVQRLGVALARPARLIPVHPAVLRWCAAIANKGAMAQSLLDSLQVDIRHTCDTMNWKPPVTVDEGLRRAAAKELV